MSRFYASLLGIALFVPAAWGQISFTDFSSTKSLKLSGTAEVVKTKDGSVLRLTKAICCSFGSAFTATPVSFQIPADTFSTFFQFRITDPGGINPADQILFSLRAATTTPLQGGNLRSTDALAIKFDTYMNKEFNETSDNHVSLLLSNEDKETGTQQLPGPSDCSHPVGVPGCMANGDIWSVWIDYDGSVLHVALADNSTVRPANILDFPIGIPDIVKGSSAYVGLIGATGGGFENHDILNWQFRTTYQPFIAPELPQTSGS
jgi:hypothetical protein